MFTDVLIDPAIERFALRHTTPLSGTLLYATEWTRENLADQAEMMSGLAEVQLLQLLVGLSGARTVLEIGTFTGVGALALASAMPRGGNVTTLETNPEYARIARRHFEQSDRAGQIQLLEGDARELLNVLPGPFDLVWIDAWKADYPFYWEAVRRKIARGGLVAADNLFRHGDVVDADSEEPGTLGMRAFAERVHADPEFDNVLLTVGDGVLLAWRRPPMPGPPRRL